MPTTRTVSTSAELYKALAGAAGGDTILLKGGNYGGFYLNLKSGFDFTFPSNVTIASADPSNPAVFTAADVRKAANITFDGITFDYTYKDADPLSKRPFVFSDSQNITFRDSVFDGDLASGRGAGNDGYGWGTGIFVRGSTGVAIEGSEFRDWYRGLVVDNVKNLRLTGNDIHSIRSDGMNLSAVQGVVIEKNQIHDFKASSAGDHRDMIQFWTVNSKIPSKDIVIRDNLLDVGQGSSTQSIFMRNEAVDYGQGGPEMFYRNVTIENSTIINAHAHGITVGQAVGVTIRNNSVLHADGKLADGWDSPVEVPRISVHGASTGVTITGNAVAAISGVKPAWKVSNNAFVQDQDPRAPNYYGDALIASTWRHDGETNAFVAREGGILDAMNAGSSLVLNPPAGLVAMFHMTAPNPATRVFDAGASQLNGADLPAGTTYTWSFGDGTTATGQRVSHSFVGGGAFDVDLTVRLPNGRTDTATLIVPVQSPEILSLDASGRFVALHNADEVALPDLKAFDEGAIQLGGEGVVATVGRGHVSDVLGAKDVSIALTLEADKAGTSGELFRLHGSFAAWVSGTGELAVRAWQQGGPNVVLATKGAKINDGNEHDVVIRIDDGQLELWVDGARKGAAAMALPLGGSTGFGSQNLVFGNPWGDANFQGDLRAFEVAVGSEDFPAKATTTVLSAGAGDGGAAARLADGSDDGLAADAEAGLADKAVLASTDEDEGRFEFQGAAALEGQAA